MNRLVIASRTRWARALVVLAALPFVASCSGHGVVRAQAKGTTTTTTASGDQDSAWQDYKSSQGGQDELESPSDRRGSGARRVLARVNDGTRLLDLATYNGSQWTTTAELSLPAPGYDFRTIPQGVEVGDVTADGRADFLVPLQASSGIGVVLSDDGGSWRLLPVQGSDGAAHEPYIGLNPRFQNGQLVSDDRTCSPTCADGAVVTIVWTYRGGMLAHS